MPQKTVNNIVLEEMDPVDEVIELDHSLDEELLSLNAPSIDPSKISRFSKGSSNDRVFSKENTEQKPLLQGSDKTSEG